MDVRPVLHFLAGHTASVTTPGRVGSFPAGVFLKGYFDSLHAILHRQQFLNFHILNDQDHRLPLFSQHLFSISIGGGLSNDTVIMVLSST